MENSLKQPKSFRILVITGSVFLILMGLFHGSGLSFMVNTMNDSNAESFIKEVFPVLYLHPSIHLIAMAVLSLSTVFMKHDHKMVLLLLSSIIIVSAIAAFYLSAWLPGILLLLAVLCFVLATSKKQEYTAE